MRKGIQLLEREICYPGIHNSLGKFGILCIYICIYIYAQLGLSMVCTDVNNYNVVNSNRKKQSVNSPAKMPFQNAKTFH